MAEKFVVVARASDIQEAQIYATVVDETPVALTRVNGVICAFGDVCTHDDGPLAEGDIADGCVICPRHGARFNLKTGKPTFPAVTPIPIYETQIEGEDVKIRLS